MTSVHELFDTLLMRWIDEGVAPVDPVEGIAPELADFVGTVPEIFTIDVFVHSQVIPGWDWRGIKLSNEFDGAFTFYLPLKWPRMIQEEGTAIVGDADVRRQAIRLTTKCDWKVGFREFLATHRVVAFAFDPLHEPNYAQWIFVTAADGSGAFQTFGLYSAQDWIVFTRGDAVTVAELNDQITSLVNSNPWAGWIRALKVPAQ